MRFLLIVFMVFFLRCFGDEGGFIKRDRFRRNFFGAGSEHEGIPFPDGCEAAA